MGKRKEVVYVIIFVLCAYKEHPSKERTRIEKQ
jgi:hypothetical protein